MYGQPQTTAYKCQLTASVLLCTAVSFRCIMFGMGINLGIVPRSVHRLHLCLLPEKRCVHRSALALIHRVQ
jgi:hypothetical protein